DLMMEEMDSGFALAHRLKTLYPDTPVILLTAVAAETGLHFGVTTADEQAWIKADTFMDKPVRPEQLKGEIERLLRRQEPPRFPVAGAPSAERHKG
ncbi:MAG: response regulator, partial [Gemmatimonadota bacterium]